MGIQGMYQFLSKMCPHLMKPKHITTHFNNKHIVAGIDISIYLYKWSATPIIWSGRRIDHLLGLLMFTVTLIGHHMWPYFVFDGPRGSNVIQKIEKKPALGGVNWAETAINDCKQMIRHLGLAYYHENEEADVVLASMSQANLLDCIISPDSDLLVRGVRNLIINYKTGATDCIILNSTDILGALNITQYQFATMAAMVGTDYNIGTRGIGLMRAYKTIQNTKINIPIMTIKNIIEEYIRLIYIDISTVHTLTNYATKHIIDVQKMTEVIRREATQLGILSKKIDRLCNIIML